MIDIYINFKNDLGCIHMSGGGEDVWRIVTIEGLMPVQYQAETVKIKGRDGQVTTSTASMPRTISIKGDLQAKNSEMLIAKASDILSKEGHLTIVKNSKKRKILCRCTAFEPGCERGGIRQFVMQFICDDPFFTDTDTRTENVSSVNKLLYGSFTIGDGIYLSTGAASAVINNRGTNNAEPVIIISNQSPQMHGDKITIRNNTTGQTLILNTLVISGVDLTVDIPKREIIMGGERRLDILDASCYLSDFHLAPGKNHLVVETGSNADRLTVTCTFENRYTEAIV